MLSQIFASVANALLSYAIDKLDPAETLKTWLKRDPARLAFEKVLARTYAAFARQYPEYVANLFNDSFLREEALPDNMDEYLSFISKTETDPGFGKFFSSEMFKWYEKSFCVGGVKE